MPKTLNSGLYSEEITIVVVFNELVALSQFCSECPHNSNCCIIQDSTGQNFMICQLLEFCALNVSFKVILLLILRRKLIKDALCKIFGLLSKSTLRSNRTAVT